MKTLNAVISAIENFWIGLSDIMEKYSQLKHGGKRPGSGRPKLKKKDKKEPTEVMRVPKSLVPEFKNIIKHHPKEWYYVLQ